MARIFLSYRKADGVASGARSYLYEKLTNRYGPDSVFMDVERMQVGSDFRECLNDELQKTEVVIVLIGPEWVKHLQERAFNQDDFVRLEIETALKQGKPVLPLLLEGAVMPSHTEVPETISAFTFNHGVEIDTGRYFKEGVERLCKDLDQHIFNTEPSHKKKKPSLNAAAIATMVLLFILGLAAYQLKSSPKERPPAATKTQETIATKSSNLTSEAHQRSSTHDAEQTEILVVEQSRIAHAATKTQETIATKSSNLTSEAHQRSSTHDAEQTEILVVEQSRIAHASSSDEARVFLNHSGRASSMGNSVYVKRGSTITVYDTEGKELRSVAIPPEVRYSLNFTVLPDGSIAFLDNRNDVIYFVDNNGKHLKTIAISEGPDRRLQNMRGIVVNGKLIVSENGNQELLAVDLKTYDVSVFRSLKQLGNSLGPIVYSEGVFYICNRRIIYSFTSESEEITKVASTPEANITGAIVAHGRLFVVVNGISRIKDLSAKSRSQDGSLYEIDPKNGEVTEIKNALNYPQGLLLLRTGKSDQQKPKADLAQDGRKTATVPSPEVEHIRTWHNNKGQSFDGILLSVSLKNQTASIRRTSDQIAFEVPFNILSAEDQDYIDASDVGKGITPAIAPSKASLHMPAPQKLKPGLAKMLPSKLLDAEGKQVSRNELAGKMVGFYFSAHWCGPCRSFTPNLVDFRDANTKDFEVVFVSKDKSPEAQMDYMKNSNMNWYTLTHRSSEANALYEQFGVRGIPKLIIVSPDGKTITENGRRDVSSNPNGAIQAWLKSN